MRYHPVVFIILAAAVLYGTPFTQPEDVAAYIIASFNKGDTTGVQSCFTDQLWTSSNNSPKRLIMQGYGKTRIFYLEMIELQKITDRAVIVAAALSAKDRHPMDGIYFYTEKRERSWLIYGYNEDTVFKKRFLEGIIPADFSLSALPSSDALLRLGEQISAALRGFTNDVSTDVFVPTCGSNVSAGATLPRVVPAYLFTGIRHPAVLETKWAENLLRGYIVIGDKHTPQQPDPDSFVLYVHRTNDAWMLYGIGGSPYAAGFLGWE